MRGRACQNRRQLAAAFPRSAVPQACRARGTLRLTRPPRRCANVLAARKQSTRWDIAVRHLRAFIPTCARERGAKGSVATPECSTRKSGPGADARALRAYRAVLLEAARRAPRPTAATTRAAQRRCSNHPGCACVAGNSRTVVLLEPDSPARRLCRRSDADAAVAIRAAASQGARASASRALLHATSIERGSTKELQAATSARQQLGEAEASRGTAALAILARARDGAGWAPARAAAPERPSACQRAAREPHRWASTGAGGAVCMPARWPSSSSVLLGRALRRTWRPRRGRRWLPIRMPRAEALSVPPPSHIIPRWSSPRLPRASNAARLGRAGTRRSRLSRFHQNFARYRAARSSWSRRRGGVCIREHSAPAVLVPPAPVADGCLAVDLLALAVDLLAFFFSNSSPRNHADVCSSRRVRRSRSVDSEQSTICSRDSSPKVGGLSALRSA